MGRQLVGGQLVAVQLQPNQVHGQRELVRVQKPVLVQVGQAPDAAQRRVGQLRLDHVRLGRRAADLAVDWLQRGEHLIVSMGVKKPLEKIVIFWLYVSLGRVKDLRQGRG